MKLIATWTGGSCGIALNGILSSFPKETKVFDLGYLSSEVRGTITVNPKTNEGIATIHENFFEFVKQDEWEADRSPRHMSD